MRKIKNLKKLFNDGLNVKGAFDIPQEEADAFILECLNNEPEFLAEIRALHEQDPKKAMETFLSARIDFIRACVASSYDGEGYSPEEIHFVLKDGKRGEDEARYIPTPDLYGSKHKGVMMLTMESVRDIYSLAVVLHRELYRADISNEKIDGKRKSTSVSEDGGKFISRSVHSKMYDAVYYCNKEEEHCVNCAFGRADDLIKQTIKKYGESAMLDNVRKKYKKDFEKYLDKYYKGASILPVAKLFVAVEKLKEKAWRNKRHEEEYGKLADLDDEMLDFVESLVRRYEAVDEVDASNLDADGDYVGNDGFYVTKREEIAGYVLAYAADAIGIDMNETDIEGFSDIVDKLTFVDMGKLAEHKKDKIKVSVVIPQDYLKYSAKDFIHKLLQDIKTDILDKQVQDENGVYVFKEENGSQGGAE